MANYDGRIRIDTQMDSDSFNRGIAKINKSLAKVAGAIGVAFGVDALVKFGKEASKIATTLETSMLRVVDIFEDANTLIVDFVKNSATGLGLSQKAAYEYASIYGNLFGMLASNTEENAKLTIRMLQASAVVASKTGRTMEDTMGRIRSGILGSTEAIEDLGINVNVAMLEMTDAFKRVAGDKSWEQLDFKEQQQIRVLGILEQAHKKYGDEVLKSSAFTKQQFAASLENLKTTIGNIINVAIIPMIEWLTRLNQMLDRTLVRVFGNIAKAQVDMSVGANKMAKSQDKLGKSIDGASKKAKSSLANFDELNVLQSGQGEDTAAQTESLSLAEGFEESKQAAEEIESPIDRLIEKIQQLKMYVDTNFGESIIVIRDLFTSVVESAGTIFEALYNSTVRILQQMLTTAGTIFVDMQGIIIPILKSINENALPVFTEFKVQMINTFENIYNSAFRIFNLLWSTAIEPNLKIMSRIISEALEIVRGFWEKWGVKIFGLVNDSILQITDILISFYEKWLQPVIETALSVIADLWDNHIKGLVENIVEFVGVFTEYFLELLNKIILPFIKFLVDKFGPIFAKVFKGVVKEVGKAIGIIIDIASGLIKALTGIIEFILGAFTGDWERAWQGISKIFEGIFDGIKAIFNGVINSIITALNFMIDKVNNLNIDIPEWIPGVGGKSIGFSIPKIPKLATGAVIAPNSPFLAMLGDQPSGVNIETPLETMLDAFRQALAEQGGNGSAEELVLQIDGDEIGRVLLPHTKKADKQFGISLVTGGNF